MRSCRTCGAATTNSRPKWGHATAWPPRTPNSRPPSDRPGTSTASACPTLQQRNSARRSPSCTYTGGRIRRRRRRSPSWSYLRPPRVEPTLEVIAVDLGGARIAETRRALRVLETSHPPACYLPRADVAPPRPAPECGPDMVRVQGVGRVFRRGVPAGSAPRAPSGGAVKPPQVGVKFRPAPYRRGCDRMRPRTQAVCRSARHRARCETGLVAQRSGE